MMKGKKSEFEGTFEKGNKIKGNLMTEFGVYEGGFKNGLMHDTVAKFRYFDGKTYNGPFEFGEMHG